MNLASRTYLLLFCMTAGLLSCGWSFSQSPYDPEFSETAGGITEHLEIFTDRGLYIIGEEILFRADCTVEGLGTDTPWSSMVYVELVDAAGSKVTDGKYRIAQGRACGGLQIPEGILTGDYHIKAYTRWMRNSGPASFSYYPLKIINPFREEVVANQQHDSNGYPYLRKENLEAGLLCKSDATEFIGGEEVRFSIEVLPDFNLERTGCCVSVVPAGTIDTAAGQYVIPDGIIDKQRFRVSYLPDLGHGASLSGSVVASGQVPVPYAKVYFSILGDAQDFYVASADSRGRFNLSIKNGEGMQELVVTAESNEERAPVVRIDQDFDSRSVEMPAGGFRMTPEEKEAARKLAMNMQLRKEYSRESPELNDDTVQLVTNRMGVPFYGTSVKRLRIDDYVKLPNLEEIFINLIPEVQFYKRRGRLMLKIMSVNNSIDVYNPMVVIDNVPVFDLEAMLALSPEKIERIDLVNDIYLKGDMVFGGLLAIHSRQGDMAGIDLPEGAYFFDLQSIQPSQLIRKPDYHPDIRQPDTRNTILWLGDVLLEKGKPADFSFRAPDLPGEYVILVRSVTPGGDVVSARSLFRVK